MGKKLLLGTILGGLTLYAWGALSHMALPLHSQSFATPADEAAVLAGVAAGIRESGVYFVPNPEPTEGATEEERKAAEEEAMQKYMQGPAMFAAVRTGPMGSYGMLFARQFAFDLLAALALTWVLLHASGLSYGGKVLLAAAVGAFAVLATHMPYWNWYSFSAAFTLAESADALIGTALAGLVLAKVTK